MRSDVLNTVEHQKPDRRDDWTGFSFACIPSPSPMLSQPERGEASASGYSGIESMGEG